ncbi:MAG: GNAT family N-acetyltransferase [Candidatus Glassbacteria bacterium]
MAEEKFEFLPLTPERWPDFERLFGPKGACAGCWCRWWRTTAREFEKNKGEGNRRAMKELVEAGVVPGVLAYDEGRPVGWCSVGPREDFVRFAGSRTLKPLDDTPVWCIVCLFIEKGWRRQGLSVELIHSAVRFARSRGARVVEGYPSVPRSGRSPDTFVYMGLPQMFSRAGFREAARPTQARSIMRSYPDDA